MKKNWVKCLFYLFILAAIQSSAQSVFPLAIGNKWHYEIRYIFHYPPHPADYFTYSVVGDTVMPNGEKFYILNPHDMFYGRYIRSDSIAVYYWDQWNNQEKLVFDISIPINSAMTINWYLFRTATLWEPYKNEYWGIETNTYPYSLGDLTFAEMWLTEFFGYSQYDFRGDTEEIDSWSLKGCIINDTLYGSLTDVQGERLIPKGLVLFQNYPNPFNPITKIKFSTSPRPSPYQGEGMREGFVTLKIYDILGNGITTLVNEEKPPGTYEVEFDGTQLTSGIYFYRLRTDNFIASKKMILLK